MAITEDLDIFLADFGVSCTAGGIGCRTVRVVFCGPSFGLTGCRPHAVSGLFTAALGGIDCPSGA
jgi:hypothetical protein